MKLTLTALLFSVLAFGQVSIDAGSASDASFIGGTPYTDSAMTDTTLRYGFNGAPFAYSFNLPNGFYAVSLTIFEPNKTAAAQRIFTMSANGQNLTTVDPFALGAVNKQTPAIIQLLVMVQAGVLRLDFKGVLSNPLVSSIAVTPWSPALSDLRPGPIVKGSVNVGGYFVDAFTVAHDDDPNIHTKCVLVAGQCPAAVEGQRIAGITGGSCTAPDAGVTIYAKLPDGSCIPLVAVPMAGTVAQALQFQYMQTAMIDQPTEFVTQAWVKLTATPGSGLIPNIDGTAFIQGPPQ